MQKFMFVTMIIEETVCGSPSTTKLISSLRGLASSMGRSDIICVPPMLNLAYLRSYNPGTPNNKLKNSRHKIRVGCKNSPRCFVIVFVVFINLALAFGTFALGLLVEDQHSEAQSVVERRRLAAKYGKITHPAISVILPAYNVDDHHLFSKAIESILSQSFQNFELILVDDGSTDNTAKRIRLLQAKDPRIRGLFLETNYGLPKALNMGIEASHGELLTWTSSDNFLEPQFLETFYLTASEYPESWYFYSDWNMVDSEQNFILRTHHDYRCPYNIVLQWQGNAAFMWRKLRGHDWLFDPNLAGVEDMELWTRIHEGEHVAPWIDLALYNYTFNHGSWRRLKESGHLDRMNSKMVKKILDRHLSDSRNIVAHRLVKKDELPTHTLSPRLLFPTLRFNYNQHRAKAVSYHRLGTIISGDLPGPDGGVRDKLRPLLLSIYNTALVMDDKLHASHINEIILTLANGEFENAQTLLQKLILTLDKQTGVSTIPQIPYLSKVLTAIKENKTMDFILNLEDDTTIFADESFRRERRLAEVYFVGGGGDRVKRPYRLAVIPSDPISAYEEGGYANWLTDYYNPLQFFDEVFLLSPLETEVKTLYGMRVIPTQFHELQSRIHQLGIHVVRAYGGFWPCDMAVRGKVSGVPVIVSVHDTNSELLHDSIAHADYVLPVSQAVADLVVRRVADEARVFMFSNRVDNTIFNPLTPLRDKNRVALLRLQFPGEIRILSVGRRTLQKNWDTLIKALSLLGQKYVLIIVGRGDRAPLINLASDLGVADRLYLIDSVDNDNLPYYHAMADVFCTPSRWEGFGIVFIEALASGSSVVVTSDVAPMNEFITDSHNGLLVKNYEDENSLARVIERAAMDEDLRTSILNNAPHSVRQFSKDYVDRWEVMLYRMFLHTQNYTHNDG